MSDKKVKSKLAFLVVSVLVLSSCNKHFTVQDNAYKEYGIDNQSEVDSSVVKYYMPYKQQMEAEMNRVIGETEQELTKSSDPETLLGNFFSDATLTEALKIDPSVQFALSTTKGGLRNTLPKGNITVSGIFELMPFENELVILKLSGASVQKVIDFIASKNGQPVAGIRMKIKNNVGYDVTISGKPFDINQTYTVLTSDYLANNGDDQSCMANPLERKNIGLKVRDALMDYIGGQTKNGKKINTQLDGRISVTNE
ncbi:5'-nucleotidase C-terminal domain-containing protein [Dyadobacter sp. NIV53]|uniref:5'-nucleotidase C-terminal domain-containing protein n=1 Tax=Dyadobacter sp. NIV53 TaxID=2861765 RepID=UPI001C8670C9|nr:5'-nucleotidase [Dyadobacter sp. NIV53]